MTLERYVLLLFVFVNAGAGVVAAAPAEQIPPWVHLSAAAVVAGCGATLVFLNNWWDTAPAK